MTLRYYEVAGMLTVALDKVEELQQENAVLCAENAKLREANAKMRTVLTEIAQEFRPGYIDVPTVAGAKAKRALEMTE